MNFEDLRARIDLGLAEVVRGAEPLEPTFQAMAARLYGSALARRPKRLRPILLLSGARLAGGSEASVFNLALALELVHDFSVILDDVMDDDELRRGECALWVEFGTGPAITGGCGLYTLAMRLALRWIAEADDHAKALTRTHAAQRLFSAAMQLHDAQLADLAAEGSLDTSLDQSLEIARGRSILLGEAATIGALAVGADSAFVVRLKRMGRALATAYSLIDDARSFTAREPVAGKRAGGDIRRRKMTYPIVAAFQALDAAGRTEVAALWRSPAPLDEATTFRIADRLERTDAVVRTERLVRQLKEEVDRELLALRNQANAVAVESLRRFLAGHFDAAVRQPATSRRQASTR